MHMFVTIITDCKEENEKGRQLTRWTSLGFENVSLVGVGSDLDSNATLETAGNIIDMLDAAEGKSGVVFANAAPRGYKEEDGKNGTDFCYFWHKDTLVLSTIRGLTLSLVKKLKLTDSVQVIKLEPVLETAVFANLIDHKTAKYIVASQFRSFDYVPRVARWIIGGSELPSTVFSMENVKDAPHAVWCIDAFGNAKTTIASKEISFTPIQKVQTNFGELTFYNRLKDLPYGETGIYIGSSGLGDIRFLEIATQSRQGSAAKTLGLSIGSELQLQ